ncbi:OadG family transporter subunit [Marinomonas sp. C2222]|uniref:Probable oxaloacetate decarboxylase gamma chain n=1 Tax=Marinomonas sargassi TaxID=2984494 RepID=A0ABT2YTZ4_9GAMM|nr:OadG family transporter subunit [Marinomonas sargassi]MCV2403369.1 OadG family transporter subunit [Marinomonas sargassi]
MNGLLGDGIGLMVLGMGFVFLFLCILIVATSFMSRLLNQFFPDVAVAAPSAKPVAAPAASKVDPKLAEAITAAVHHYRNNKNS